MSEQNPSFEDLLQEYRAAVKNTEFWTDHGRHGDGKLTSAFQAESVARSAVLKAYHHAK